MDEFDDLLDPGIKQNTGGGYEPPATIPNANAVLTLGILSIVGCGLYILPGLICGIIALSLYQKVKKTYDSNPQRYQTSFKNAKAGFICAIIGTSLSGLYFIFLVVFLIAGISSFGRF